MWGELSTLPNLDINLFVFLFISVVYATFLILYREPKYVLSGVELSSLSLMCNDLWSEVVPLGTQGLN